MTTAFQIVESLAECARRIRIANGFRTDAGETVHKNVRVFSASDVHPLVFIGYPGADSVKRYPGSARIEKAAEFQLSMEYEIQPDDDLDPAADAYRDLVVAVFGPGSPGISNVVSYEYESELHIPRLNGGKFGQMSIFILIRWIENVGQE